MEKVHNNEIRNLRNKIHKAEQSRVDEIKLQIDEILKKPILFRHFKKKVIKFYGGKN